MDKNKSIPEETQLTKLNPSMPFGEFSGNTSCSPTL
jgi:hypothetical protein